MNIKLITFDLDDTLWDTAPVIASAEVVLRDWLQANAPLLGDVPVEHLFAIRERIVLAEPELKHRISALRRRVLTRALEDVGYGQMQAQQLAEQGFEVFLQARHKVEIFPEVQPMLELLSQHYALGVITNGNADVSRLGLADYFRFALCAEDLGIGKPDPAPFVEALRRSGVPASEAVHVGDHPRDDIAGAQRAGLRAVWFNPQASTRRRNSAPVAPARGARPLAMTLPTAPPCASQA
jgi:FMN hydrolase / 5-amino-6-(5-phospho-D-ribitylamino)uracil phosphatase